MGSKRLEFDEIGWNIQEKAGKDWNRLEHAGISCTMLDKAAIGQNRL